DDHLGERRRGDPLDPLRRGAVYLAGPRWRAALLVPLREAGDLRVPVRAASADEGCRGRPLGGAPMEELMQTTRRELLTCAAAWAGAGVVWTVSSGILSSRALASSAGAAKIRRASSPGDLHFVQISDTHIGFDKEANPDPVATAREAVAKINAL